jgi:endonuclease-3
MPDTTPISADLLLERLEALHPDAHCELNYRNPLELLIATILSAQCTDERVNQVTASLFRKYTSPEDYLAVPEEELQEDIRPTGFFRNKTKSIRGACRHILDTYGGEVPDTMEDLLTLPGVARKTANVVLSNAFGKAEGIAVDTHVSRIAQLTGITRNTDPNKIERDLLAYFPREKWALINHLLIFHGRRVCIARRPRCEVCPLNDVCPSAFAWQEARARRLASNKKLPTSTP